MTTGADQTDATLLGEGSGPPPLGWRRYLRLSRFGLRLMLHIVLREIVGRRFHLAKSESRKRLARDYRDLAGEVGGLTVKLGQFLSLRHDLLPTEVLDELAALQDRMRAVSFEAVVEVVEQDLGRPIGELYAELEPSPLACASLAQVHRARLPDGAPVVVKILRPETSELFRSDLAAVASLVRVLRLFPRLRREIDLDGMLAEFTDVTLRELDLVGEGRNAERFADDFRDDPWVWAPAVDWRRSGHQTLTMEDVGALKVSDTAGLDAAGIDRTVLARQIVRVYMEQIFVHHFVHADPHPGNLFIVPASEPSPAPFRIVFIDFGMVVEIPEPERQWLREFLIGLGLRDADLIVRSYVRRGMLRPEVDPERVTEMTADLLEQHQELLLGLSPDLSQTQARSFFASYADLLETGYPFEIPMDLLFMYRAMGAFGSLAKQLDPEVDLSAEAAPFAARFLWGALREDLHHRLDAAAALGASLTVRPVKLERVLVEAHKALHLPAAVTRWLGSRRQRTLRATLSPRDRRTLRSVERSLSRLTAVLAALGLLVAGSLFVALNGLPTEIAAAGGGLEAAGQERVGWIAVAVSSIALIWNLVVRK